MSKLKHFILLSVFFSCAFASKAQQIEWSNQQKVKSKTYYSQVLGQNAAGVFLLRSKTNDFSKDISIERYKANLTLELTKDLPLVMGGYLEKMVLLETGILVFCSRRNHDSDAIEILCYKLDDNLNQSGEMKKLLSVPTSKFKGNRNFYIRTSGDKKYISVVYFTNEPDDKYKCLLNVAGFNEQLNTLFTATQNFTFPSEDIFVTSVEPDNAGNVFMLIDFPKNIVRRSKEKDERKFSLYAYYKESNKLTDYSLDLDSFYISDLGMAVNNYDKSVSVAGYYSKENNDDKCNGFFQVKVDAETGELKLKTFNEFDKSFVAKVAGSMQNENTAHLSNLTIKRIVPRSDGGCIIIGEKYYETKQIYTYYVNGFQQTSSRTVYNFDEIVVISQNPDGTTQFRDFIKKKQSSMSDAGYYSSFVLLNTNERLSFIYNSETGEDGDVMISTVSPKGESETRILVKALSYYVSIMPPEARQVSANSAIISTLKDKRFSLLRITY